MFVTFIPEILQILNVKHSYSFYYPAFSILGTAERKLFVSKDIQRYYSYDKGATMVHSICSKAKIFVAYFAFPFSRHGSMRYKKN